MTDEKTAAALAARSERAVADVIARYSRHLYTVAAASAPRCRHRAGRGRGRGGCVRIFMGASGKVRSPAAARSRHGFRSWRARALSTAAGRYCAAAPYRSRRSSWPTAGRAETLLAGERRAALNAAVDALAEPDREILLRRYYFGQKPREIAAALGLDKKQVDNRLYQTKRAAARERDRRGRRVICAHSARKTTVTFRAYLPKKPACRSENAAPRARAVRTCRGGARGAPQRNGARRPTSSRRLPGTISRSARCTRGTASYRCMWKTARTRS